MHVILIGPQGSGKGTQAAAIAPAHGLVHLSTGDLFRAAIASKTELGTLAKGYMDRGELVPDDVTLGIVDARLQELAAQGASGALFDGFPRTPAQAEGLDRMLAARGERIDAVVELAVPHDVLVARLAGRRVCPGCGATYHLEFNPPKVDGTCDSCGATLVQRSDDQPEAIERRLALYAEQTEPLLDHYGRKGIVTRVDGDQAIGTVSAAISSAITGAAHQSTA